MEKDDVMKSLKSCLVLNKGSTSLTDLKRDFLELVGKEIPYNEFGYETLQAFLLDIPGVSSCGTEGGVPTFTVNDDKIQHIKDLVEGQKTRTSSKKKKGNHNDNSYGYTGRNYNLDCNYGRSSKHYFDIIRRFNDNFDGNYEECQSGQRKDISKLPDPNFQQSSREETNNGYSNEPAFSFGLPPQQESTHQHDEASFDTGCYSPPRCATEASQNGFQPSFDDRFSPRGPQIDSYHREEPSFDTGLLLPSRTDFPRRQHTRHHHEPGSSLPSTSEKHQNVAPSKPTFDEGFSPRHLPRRDRETSYDGEEPYFNASPLVPLPSPNTGKHRQNGFLPSGSTVSPIHPKTNGHYHEEPSYDTGILLPTKYQNFGEMSQHLHSTGPSYGCVHSSPTSRFNRDLSKPKVPQYLPTAECAGKKLIVLNQTSSAPPGFAQGVPKLCTPPPGFSQDYLFEALNQELDAMSVGADQQLTTNVADFMQQFQVCKPDPEKVKQVLLSPTSSQSSQRSTQVAHDTIKVTLRNNIHPAKTPAQRTVDRRNLPNATLFGHQLVGDDFLLSLSFMEMGYEFYSMPFPWDLCISGMTITDCLKELRNTRKLRPKVILLVGAMDILSGASLEKMKLSMQILLRELCGRVHSVILLTTPPLTLHACFEEFWNKQLRFNSWLKQQHGKSCVQVVDIWNIFIDCDDILCDLFYKKSCVPQKMGDSVILWNKAGIARVVQAIKKVIFS